MTGGNTPNLVLIRMVELFLKIPLLKEILKFYRNWLKEDCKTYAKKELRKTLKQILNEWLKTYKMNFINKRTSKQKVLNFVLMLG